MTRPASLAIAILVVFSVLATAAPPAAAETSALYLVAGTVTSDKGDPVEGAYVYGETRRDDGLYSADRTVTGADGTFRLQLAAGQAHLSVQHPTWNSVDSRDIEIDGNETGLAFTLRSPPPKTAIVEGRVLGADGKPVEGATVRLEQPCCYAYSDGSGGGMAHATPTTAPTPASDSDASVSSDESKTAPSSQRIMPAPCCYDSGHTVTTGPDGAYRFETYGGPRMIHAEARGYAQTSVSVEAKDGATVTKDVRLEKVPDKDAVLQGRVVDAKTGAPIANAQVSLANLAWSRYESDVTSADGTFRIETLPGWSQLSVHVYNGYGMAEPAILREGGDSAVSTTIARPSAGPSYYQSVSSFHLASGETTRDVKLEAKPEPTVVLQGYVVDPEAKKGVPGAQVSVWNQDTGDWGNAVTDATGSYKMLVRPGHYTANSWADGHLAGAVTFVIAAGETLKRVDIDSPAGQTRYAPCDDCYDSPVHKGGVMYDSAPAPASMPMTEENAGTTSSRTLAADSSAGSGENNGAAPPSASSESGTSYQGSGGGLPAYDPQTSPEMQATGVGAAQTDNTVPGPGAFAALVGIGVAALALARRRHG